MIDLTYFYVSFTTMSASQQSKRLKSSTAVYTCFNPLCTFQTFNLRGFWNHVAHTGHTYDNQLNERLLMQLRNTKPVLYNLFIEKHVENVCSSSVELSRFITCVN